MADGQGATALAEPEVTTDPELTSQEPNKDSEQAKSKGAETNKTKTKTITEAEYSRLKGLENFAAKEKERIEREAAERVQRIEQEQLEQQGKWEEIAKQKQAELDKIKAKFEATQQAEQFRATATEKGVPEYAEIWIAARDGDPKRYGELMEAYVEQNNARIKAEVVKQLETGIRPAGSGPQPPKNIADMPPDEWAAYKKANNIY